MPNVNLHMHPETPPVTWEDFCQSTGPFAIALDGYVIGGPDFDLDTPRANFNHHEGVDRLGTLATCGQVMMALRQDFPKLFRDETGFRAEVYVNDCDQDVALSWFQLNNVHMVIQSVNPLLNRLLDMENKLDATAGAYPYPEDLPSLQELAWIFEPYHQFKLSGAIDLRDAQAFTSVLTDTEHRIMQHITGKGGQIPTDTRYERIGGGQNWALIKEIGGYARHGLFSDGIRAYVTVREKTEGRWVYTIGRMSRFTRFNVPQILKALDKAEGNKQDHWGGGDTIGGSPRTAGSKLSPEEVTEIVNANA